MPLSNFLISAEDIVDNKPLDKVIEEAGNKRDDKEDKDK